MAARSRDTSASAEAVWRIWCDPSSWSDWNPDIARVTMNGPLAVGTTGHMSMRSGREHDIMFDEVQAGRLFQLVANNTIPGHPFAFRCEVQPQGTGSRITQSMSVRGPLGGLLGPMMGETVAKTFEPILEALAKKAESGS